MMLSGEPTLPCLCKRKYSVNASEVVGLANASIKGHWKFGSRRGALLIMSQPLSSYLPPEVLLKHLVDIPTFKNKVLVTQVVSCPAYSLYLSTASKWLPEIAALACHVSAMRLTGFVDNEAIDLALIGTLPTLPGIAIGVGVGAAWWSQKMSGMYREGCDRNGLYNYTPLYTLKKIRQKHLLRRESPVPEPEGDDLWVSEIVFPIINNLIKLLVNLYLGG